MSYQYQSLCPLKFYYFRLRKSLLRQMWIMKGLCEKLKVFIATDLIENLQNWSSKLVQKITADNELTNGKQLLIKQKIFESKHSEVMIFTPAALGIITTHFYFRFVVFWTNIPFVIAVLHGQKLFQIQVWQFKYLTVDSK